MQYWLMKSEPDVFSIDDLKRDKVTLWEGVRNYQARNFMMKEMQEGDAVLFYHSNAEPPGIAGLAKIVSGAEPDPTQFKKNSKYYDSKSTTASPRWHCVRVGFEEKFRSFVSRADLSQDPLLEKMRVLQKGQRLSIMPVTAAEFKRICQLGRK